MTRVFLLLSAWVSLGYAEEIKQLSPDDVTVIAHLHGVDENEIELGRLAQANGDASGQAYGRQLVADHLAFEAKLGIYAKKHGISTLPDDTTRTDAETRSVTEEMTKLKALKGAAFEHELGSRMAIDHERELLRADAAIARPHDRELIGLLMSLKPTLQAHADVARRLAK